MTVEATPGTPTSLGKRRRVDDKNEGGLLRVLEQNIHWAAFDLVQYDKLWFEDGSIVLRTLNKPAEPALPPTVSAFKCHKSVLATRSPFFQSVFELLPDDDTQPNVDGVPCIDFADDFEDMRDFLLMIYGMLPIHKWSGEPDVIKLVSGPLKLAMKYDVLKESKQLVDFMEGFWPVKYTRWTSREEYTRICDQNYHHLLRHKEPYKFIFHQIENFGNPAIKWSEPASVLVLAEQLKLKRILRSAWYDVARFYACGQKPFGTPDASVTEDMLRRSVNLDLLSGGQMRRLIIGRGQLQDLLGPRIQALSAELGQYKEALPEDHDGCIESVEMWWAEAMVGTRLVDMARDPLGELTRLRMNIRNEGAIEVAREECTGQCIRHWFEAKLYTAGEEVWDMLPEIFGFEE